MTSLRHILVFACLVGCCRHHCLSQSKPPVLWHFRSDHVGDTEVVLTLSAALAPGWHLYTQYMNEGGPMPTRITLERSDKYAFIGQAEEKGNAVTFRDDIYEMEITWYSDRVAFLQRVKLIHPWPTIKGTIEYMTCNEHMCIPHKETFTIDIQPPSEAP